jgi:prepilin-type N-terminal cleavage/methylation domain-containing protein
MRDERGMSLAEISVVVMIAAILITVTLTYSIPWLGREEMRGAVYHVQEYLQLARIQAVSRNRSSRFLIDTTTRRVQVYDLNDPADTSDDIQLYDLTLPKTVTFSRPDSGSAVTLATVSGSTYQATFASDGSVSAGAGLIAMQGGDGSYRVTLYGAGGVRVERWDGAAWNVGS